MRAWITAPLLPLPLIAALLGCGGGSNQPPVPPPSPPPVSVTPPPVVSTAPAPAVTAPAEVKPPPPLSAPPGKLNVLLITVDSLRADMPWSGYDRDIAPTLTAFEKKAVSYTHAYAISSYTAMSVAGLLAGRYPSELSRSGYFFSSYPESVLFFPQLLQKAGVRTLTAQAHWYFNPESCGFQHGFDDYEIVEGISRDPKTDKDITSPQHLALAEKMLGDKANTGKTFFAWFHFMDPHDEYLPHEGFGPYGTGKHDRDKYDAEVAFTDHHVGKLLEFVAAQPWAKDTAILLSSDHGEAFGEHKRWRHGFEIYEMLVRVPLMVQAPGLTPRHIDAPRSAIDLAPTILDLVGAPPEPSFQGQSLVPELYGKPAEPRDVIVDLPRTSDNDRRRALIHGHYKIIAWGDDFSWELFDIGADPAEENDLKKSDRALFAEMKRRYKEAVKKVKDICPKHTDKLRGKDKGRRC
jgi:arylsulfatase A-like enzyme